MFVANQLQQGKDEANADLDTGYQTASDQIGKAGTTFGNLASGYAGGSKLYLDASGANGTDAATAARGAFTASPAYGFNLDQGLQALDRTRAVNGTLASGNADTDAMKFASGLASNEYGNWLSNLGNIDTKYANAVGNQAGTYTTLGNLGFQTGATKAGLAASTAQGVAQAGSAGLQAGQQAQMNGLNAIFSGMTSLGNLIGGAGKAYSSFGGGGK